MPSQLGSARLIADHVRFSGDYFRESHSGSDYASQRLQSHFAQDSIQITSQVTPSLAHSIKVVCERLALPEDAIRAYVYASPEIQAYCVSDGPDRCFIRFSSGLVGLLDSAELEFVAGHELGHFLLAHAIGSNGVDPEVIEMKMLQRAQEISADRMGLLACDSLDVALKALMKSVSGLTEAHLRFDIGQFIAQIRDLQGDDFIGQGDSSHPSMLVRCRALLWFSLSEAVSNKDWAQRPDDLNNLDVKVSRDLANYIDGPEREKIELLKSDVMMWLAAEKIVSDGSFDRQEQMDFSNFFGADNLHKLRSFLGSCSATSVIDEVSIKLDAATGALKASQPYSYNQEMIKLKESLVNYF